MKTELSHKQTLGYWAVVSIGIGGMVGGGIFAVLGFAVQLARGGTPVAFVLAGVVALLTSYSYAKLSITYPSQGGTVEFLNQAYGSGVFTGGLNVLLWMSYIVMLSLYAHAFGSYGAVFFPRTVQVFATPALISGVVVLLTGLNVLGTKIVGEYEEFIVGFKICILLLFIAVGLWSVNVGQVQPSSWSRPLQLISGGMIIFLAYEGFELIANTSREVKNPQVTLPRAYYSAVVFVIVLYALVSLVTVGNLSIAKIVSSKDYALAEAAKPFLGNFGFTLIAVAALLSTASAINATLYGTSRVSYIIAKDGELPQELEKKIWRRPIEGLLITSGLTILVANFFDLSSISMMGSAGFLLIFAAVNGCNVRLHNKTGSYRWISVLGCLVCLCALGALLWNTAKNSAAVLWVLVVMLGASFTIEVVYQKFSGRHIRSTI